MPPAGYNPYIRLPSAEYDENDIDPDRVREQRLNFSFKCISVKLVEYVRIEITIKDLDT